MDFPVITVSILLFIFFNILGIHVYLEEQINYTKEEKNTIKLTVALISLITPLNLYLALLIFFMLYIEALEKRGTIIKINKFLFHKIS